ncbi:MAG: EAL domain-containing protein [Gammaproteobacteria bacterium]
MVDESSHMELPNPVFNCLEKKAAIHGTEEILLIRRDGLEYGIEYSVTPIISEQKTLKGTVMMFRDITEKRKMEKTLSWQDTHDPLTGLINRNEFNRRLVHLVANTEDRQSEHALCLIDLDRFRLINDSCGNEAGDALLKKVANRLRNLMRDTDTLARIANDEFALIMYSCSLEKARLITEIFREEINKLKFDWEDKHYTISTSIGITTISPTGTDDIAQVYRNVELACNKAKSSGGNGLQVFSPELTDHRKYTGHLKLLEELQHNLNHESFKIYTQSIKPLDDLNDTLMHEVLLRMKNENGEIISAESFIQTAEAYHLLASIDKWVLKFIMEMIAYGKPIFKDSHIINVNISKQSILNEQFIEYLDRLLKEYELAPSRICLEINERHFYGNVNSLQRFISLIKQIGCKIALDDFNYNPETINNIRKLNVDYVKLDARQFNEIGDVKGFNYSLLESINKINHMVGAQTIVKCLDNDDMLEQLFEIGTDYIQGYAYEPPKPVSNN